MNLKKLFFKLCPENLRHKILRKIVIAPDHSNREITYKIASTQEELEAAFRLLHDCYSAKGLIHRQSHGLRCNLYSVMPYTTVIIAKRGEDILGTLSLIKDSPLGMPSDKIYKNENDFYRQEGAQLVEVSALAIDPKYRKTASSGQISLYLMKYLYEYCERYMGCDTLCAVVHPNTYDFYKGLLGFKKNGKIIKYNFVRGALAMHITRNMADFRCKWGPQNYPAVGQNVGNFLNSETPNFMIYPQRKTELLLDPVLTKDMLEYFLKTKTALINELLPHDLNLIKEAYQPYFEIDYGTPAHESARLRPFRFPAQVPAALVSKGQVFVGTITDLSANGLFFKTTSAFIPLDSYEIIFKLDDELIKEKVRICWQSTNEKKHTHFGLGLSMSTPSLRIQKHIRNSHLNYKTVKTRDIDDRMLLKKLTI